MFAGNKISCTYDLRLSRMLQRSQRIGVDVPFANDLGRKITAGSQLLAWNERGYFFRVRAPSRMKFGRHSSFLNAFHQGLGNSVSVFPHFVCEMSPAFMDAISPNTAAVLQVD